MDVKKTKIIIRIIEYVDGTYELDAKHLHYAFDDNYNADNVKAEDLGPTMRKICDYAAQHDVDVTFRF